MYTSVEIEFKTEISKEEYEKLINLYDLKDKISSQINYYFDTQKHELINKKIVLRIREKSYNIKITSKTPQEIGVLERHIVLDKDEAYKMIENGFDASIIGINEFVNMVAKLQTYRATMEYKSGTLFFDMNQYYNTTDYEIEFETNDEELGKKEFLEFLKEHNITYKKMVSKSKRAYKKSSQMI